MKVLGLLGGMGPEATADVLTKIARAARASRDQDHIPVLVRNIPQIPDRTSALLSGGPSPEAALAEGARALRLAGADFLAIACNTAHHWHDAVSQAAGLPVVHIAEAVAAALEREEGERPVGLLATRGTLKSGFYQRRLGRSQAALLLPDDREQRDMVDPAIMAAKAGYWPLAESAAEAAVKRLVSRGARRVVLACTELPLALASSPRRGLLLDANMALAEMCVDYSRRAEPQAAA